MDIPIISAALHSHCVIADAGIIAVQWILFNCSLAAKSSVLYASVDLHWHVWPGATFACSIYMLLAPGSIVTPKPWPDGWQVTCRFWLWCLHQPKATWILQANILAAVFGSSYSTYSIIKKYKVCSQWISVAYRWHPPEALAWRRTTKHTIS